jgi:hypothetical protein
MKLFKYITFLGIVLLTSCNGFLDKEPISTVTSTQYLTNVANLDAYVIGCYDMLPTHGQWDFGTFQLDNNTDNMADIQPATIFAPGLLLVSQTGGSWWFNDIYKTNYFFENVIPNLNKGKISGNKTLIQHDLGEMYFLRAFAYFERLKSVGDFPIITKTLPDNRETLIEYSKRQPRNEVARFILNDLDSAIVYLLPNSPDGKRNRISKNCAYLFKSRVALYEGTWLKYFNGTPFVPNGPNWPGKDKDYNKNYEYPSGSIDNEINFFLSEAMNAASIVADNVQLVINSGSFQSSVSQPANRYFDMFGAVDMSSYNEVLLWRCYNQSLGVTNNVDMYETRGNNGVGTTRSMIEAFLMKDGNPIYAAINTNSDNTYYGDTSIYYIPKNRDSRLQLFLKIPGDLNLHTPAGDHGVTTEPGPNILGTSGETKYTTGYAIRKGLNFDGQNTNQAQSSDGSIIFRGAEAYLNYIEACYEKTGIIDQKADSYWRALRTRANINPDYNSTISKTDMSKEAQLDWGAYSSGKIIDATLFNIRRERRCELMAEGFRNMDLRRWRSMDQLISTPYYVEGFNLWDVMYNWKWYKTSSGSSKLIEGKNVSSREFGKYLQPYRILGANTAYNGYRWAMAHYLDPIATQHFIDSSINGDVSTSPIYQNPYWSTTAGTGALQ